MAFSEVSPNILKNKQHYEILDGLRGVAAVSVVVFHFMEFVYPNYADNFIAHSYLAVDFFFCLSGFVLAYAYDNRIAEMGIATFFKLRLIRLQPLVVIGAILGLLTFVFDPFSDLYAKYGLWETVKMFFSSCFMIPYPLVQERYFNLFHLNPPTWSLFWEYVANVFYAFLLYKLNNKILWILTLVAAVILCFVAFDANYVGVGWSGDSFFGGGARVFYSFLAGMLVYRFNWIIKSRLGFVSLSVLLVAAFVVPFIKEYNWFIDAFIVVVYFPFLVALGAGAELLPGFKKICKLSGDISYPLYMVHYPFLWVFYSYIEKYKPDMTFMNICSVIGLVALLIFSYLMMQFVDVPIRKFLLNKMKRS
ncbi:acyltransferase family protein [Flavobacterium sp. GA093]|uniref:Acyltransferase family protein n=1 Tax=Flavobacterium hydrocarbonoxydans TaxID=2683249 RepID=A0A6I4NL79_9FLAO|nr:acyltransferase [Flavobacterium hydrocarbonoxydans]MWB95168.1 acyltransferase family protein [Flavobacterium hydrocarbonoxydans]